VEIPLLPLHLRRPSSCLPPRRPAAEDPPILFIC
jgi:hypothetical protein